MLSMPGQWMMKTPVMMEEQDKKIFWEVKKEMDKCFVCSCCGEEHGLDDKHEVEIKGETKTFCKECVTAIKGFK